jgi:hypothetical protein
MATAVARTFAVDPMPLRIDWSDFRDGVHKSQRTIRGVLSEWLISRIDIVGPGVDAAASEEGCVESLFRCRSARQAFDREYSRPGDERFDDCQTFVVYTAEEFTECCQAVEDSVYSRNPRNGPTLAD